jgi:hypothetical protein
MKHCISCNLDNDSTAMCCRKCGKKLITNNANNQDQKSLSVFTTSLVFIKKLFKRDESTTPAKSTFVTRDFIEIPLPIYPILLKGFSKQKGNWHLEDFYKDIDQVTITDKETDD